MTKAAFYKGVRLHQHFQGWEETPAGDAGRRSGTTRMMGALVTYGPNWILDVLVRCAVRPYADDLALDRQTRFNVAMAQMLDSLLGVSKGLGTLAWCQDDDQSANVTGSFLTGPGVAITHDAPGGSWVPAVGWYALLRNKTTGAGFVSAITAVGAGTITVDLEVDITAAWQVWSVQMHYPTCKFDTMSKGPTNVPSGDYHRTGPAVSYKFSASGRVIIASGLLQDLG